MVQASVDYATTYFEFPVVDKIHGEPSYETLKKLKKQLKANALAVPSTLGGGNFGLLGLVLTDPEYARISNEQFVEPNHPGTLVVPQFTANHDLICLQEEHKAEKETYNDCMAVKKTLTKQIVGAVEPKYLKDIRDPVTISLLLPVHEILQHLFENYGQVTTEALATE